MLQVARLAPNLLHETGGRVADFLRGQLNSDGGGKDRAGESDLYYTVFVLEGLTALRTMLPVDAVRSYLESFEDGAYLDLVHLSCLARCWANLPQGQVDSNRTDAIMERLYSFRSADGGFAAESGAAWGTVYHCFLALGTCQDLARSLHDPDGLYRCISAMETADGAYANEKDLQLGTTPTTAAAATLLRHLDKPISPRVGDWLMARVCDQGGFLALPNAPLPDLLSTATALHALSGMHVELDGIKERCLDFLDTLWTGKAFCGNWADDFEDSEYTYYALLALGHLSL